jgi:general secretion pathway protein A
MYERFYGLRERPFNLTPDPEFLYLSRRHKEALDQVTYGVTRREGFSLITGDVGTGKTTLCWSLLGRLEGSVRTALVLNPMLSEEDLLRTILQDFGVRGAGDVAGGAEDPPSTPLAPYDPAWMHGLSKKELLDELNNFLLKRAQEDVFCVLILDEAQNLSSACLEQLRMLSNLETAKKKLLQIIFVGQLELGDKLKSGSMKALNQRISIRNRIEPLSRKETRDYIYHRLRVAKAPRDLTFTRSALGGIYRHSKGYPRLINLICDRALLAGFSERSYKINRSMVVKSVKVLKRHAELRLPPYMIPRVLVPTAAVVLVVMLTIFFPAVSRWIRPVGVHEPGGSVVQRTAIREVRTETPTAPASPVKSDPAPLPSAPAPVPEARTETPASPLTVSGTSKAPSPAASGTPASPRPEAPRSTRSAPPPEAASEPGTQAHGSYLIQVHSFKSRQVADETIAKMRRDGYPALIRSRGAWSVIFVGPFGDYESARESAAELAGKYGASPIIRRSAEKQETGSQPE